MKQEPDLSRIQELMKSGRLSAAGFLGDDTRPLSDIMEQDFLELKKLGLTHHEVADALERIMKEGRKGFGNPVQVGETLTVTVDENRGVVPCPFRHGHLSRKIDALVKNSENSRILRYSDLSIHLVREHGFYQGKGSPYRLEPREILEVLDEFLKHE